MLDEDTWYEECYRCLGHGFELDGSSLCPVCEGMGYLEHDHEQVD